MPQIIAFSGKSNSGKTTLICKLAEILRAQGKSVGVIKHDPKDKAEFDTKGKKERKDSYKFSLVAQNVAVISPKKSVIFGFCTQGDDEEQEKESGAQGDGAQKNSAQSESACVAQENSARDGRAQGSGARGVQGALSAYELREFERALEFFGACDYVFVEGLRTLPYRRIIVARGELDHAYLPYGVAIAIDRELRDRIDVASVGDLEVLDLNNPQEILDFIDKECVCKGSK
ncbi:molybdopterin-guanine dinucleotide biosynthesis protein B [uncultured Helicobacter sp.]|uniref:molybdopterin-guanine dinucleotide biosynthesis protein B n=1 Tax=uncultured Helicobacter sp. TaxID=175537 RepID=UPI00374FF4D5